MFHSTHRPYSRENSENSCLDSELKAIQKVSMLYSNHLFTTLHVKAPMREQGGKVSIEPEALLKCPLPCFGHRAAGDEGRAARNYSI